MHMPEYKYNEVSGARDFNFDDDDDESEHINKHFDAIMVENPLKNGDKKERRGSFGRRTMDDEGAEDSGSD